MTARINPLKPRNLDWETAEKSGSIQRYSTRNSSKGALLQEAEALFSYLAKGATIDSLRDAALDKNLLGKETRETRKRCWNILRSRYLSSWPDNDHHPIAALFNNETRRDLRRLVLFYHYALSDRFAYEATTELLHPMAQRGNLPVAARDIHEFLDKKTTLHPEIKTWTAQTRRSLVSHYLSALRDFGLLEGKVRKRIRRPIVPTEIILYMATRLRDGGATGREVIEHPDFRLLFLDAYEVEGRLSEAAAKGLIRFHRSGRIVSLDLPWRSLFDYAQTLG
jgi:hypothetical protein